MCFDCWVRTTKQARWAYKRPGSVWKTRTRVYYKSIDDKKVHWFRKDLDSVSLMKEWQILRWETTPKNNTFKRTTGNIQSEGVKLNIW